MLALLDGLGRAPRLLFLGAHSDDIEIGCGGTVLELAERFPDAAVDWVVFAAAGERAVEAKASAFAFCGDLDAHVAPRSGWVCCRSTSPRTSSRGAGRS